MAPFRYTYMYRTKIVCLSYLSSKLLHLEIARSLLFIKQFLLDLQCISALTKYMYCVTRIYYSLNTSKAQ